MTAKRPFWVRVQGFVGCLWRKVFPHPWDRYVILFTHDHKEVWCRRRNGKCPLYIATVDPAELGSDRTGRVLMRTTDCGTFVVVAVEHDAPNAEHEPRREAT